MRGLVLTKKGMLGIYYLSEILTQSARLASRSIYSPLDEWLDNTMVSSDIGKSCIYYVPGIVRGAFNMNGKLKP